MQCADIILLSDAIFDSVHDEPFSGCIAIRGEKIIAVCAKEKADEYCGEKTLVMDFGDKLISPGFCDGHAHLDGSAQKAFAEIVSGLDDCKNEEECIVIVKKFADEHPHLNRIIGTNWVLTSWLPIPKPPTRHSLDRVFPDKPVYLLGADGHSLWINTKAIEESGLHRIIEDHPDWPEEWYPREESGEFTGYLAEMACHTVHYAAERYTQAEREEFQEKYLKTLPAMGLTAFTDVTPMFFADLPFYFRRLRKMENAGELPVRVYAWAGRGPGEDSEDVSDIEKLRVFEEFMCSDMLRIAGVKSIIDGIPFSYTAAMVEPYADKPESKGEFLNAPETFKRWTTKVNAMGYGVKYHCTGDGAARLAIDCFEESAKHNDLTGLRNAVEHMDAPYFEDVLRMKKLGVISGTQPAHLIMCKGIHCIREGLERARREWNYRRMLDEAGILLSIGTDSPVVEIDPYINLYKAVTRLDVDGMDYSPYTAGQALTLAEAIRYYTWGSAYASNMEEKTGTIEAGKYADIVVSDRNLFAIDPKEIKDASPVLTMCSGKITFSR